MLSYLTLSHLIHIKSFPVLELDTRSARSLSIQMSVQLLFDFQISVLPFLTILVSTDGLFMKHGDFLAFVTVSLSLLHPYKEAALCALFRSWNTRQWSNLQYVCHRWPSSPHCQHCLLLSVSADGVHVRGTDNRGIFDWVIAGVSLPTPFSYPANIGSIF